MGLVLPYLWSAGRQAQSRKPRILYLGQDLLTQMNILSSDCPECKYFYSMVDRCLLLVPVNGFTQVLEMIWGIWLKEDLSLSID